MDSPQITYQGLSIHADRHGDHVTGRVEYPYATHGQSSCPIDYRSERPTPNPHSPTPNPQSLDPAGTRRLEAVRHYQALIRDNPRQSRGRLLDRAAQAYGVSPSSIRVWTRKFEIEGPDALRNHYASAPTTVITLSIEIARDAVLICGWWAYRIGNCPSIGTKMMHAGGGLLTDGYPLADILATIEAYYEYDADRDRYPYKSFARWARYDFARWLHRAAAGADDQRIRQAAHERRRDVRNRPNRQALRDLAPPVDPPLPPNPQSPIPNPQSPTSNPLRDAQRLTALGQRSSARRLLAKAVSVPGPAPLAANDDPRTVAESLQLLDDSYRRMLLDAARGDRVARNQAYALMGVWWSQLPAILRRQINFQLHDWQAEHGIKGPGILAKRRFLLTLPHLQPRRSGVQRLAVAARLPA